MQEIISILWNNLD